MLSSETERTLDDEERLLLFIDSLSDFLFSTRLLLSLSLSFPKANPSKFLEIRLMVKARLFAPLLLTT
jgi:hypothetical protein